MKYKDIPVWSIILSFFFIFASCRDEMAGKGGVLEVEEGIPGTLTLSVTSGNPALHVVTRKRNISHRSMSLFWI